MYRKMPLLTYGSLRNLLSTKKRAKHSNFQTLKKNHFPYSSNENSMKQQQGVIRMLPQSTTV
jgi:hypothetical protein